MDAYVNKVVQIITNDGRVIVGVLKGFDQTTNVILEECHERVFSTDAGVEQVVLGLYIVRGDNIAIVGEVDEEKGERPFVRARQAGDGEARPSPQSVVQRAPPPLWRPQKMLDVQRRPRVGGAHADARHAARQALQQRGP